MHPACRCLPRRCRLEEFVTRPQLARSSGADPCPEPGRVCGHTACSVRLSCHHHSCTPWGSSVHVGVGGYFLVHLDRGQKEGGKTGAASSAVTGEGKRTWEPFQPLGGCAALPWPPAPPQPGVQPLGDKQGGSLRTGLCKGSLPCARQLLFAQRWNCGTCQCFYVNK